MNITLTPEMEKIINDEISSGNYDSPDDVLRESLRLLKEQKLSRQVRRENLRREVQKGIDQIRNGQLKTYDSADEMIEEIIKEARTEFEAKTNNGK